MYGSPRKRRPYETDRLIDGRLFAFARRFVFSAVQRPREAEVSKHGIRAIGTPDATTRRVPRVAYGHEKHHPPPMLREGVPGS